MIHTEELHNTKTQKSVQDLIKGNFDAHEAEEIINHLFNKKINFHECKNFSNEIRFGESNLKSLERIQELKLSAETLKGLIEEAKATNKMLKISSTISVQLIES